MMEGNGQAGVEQRVGEMVDALHALAVDGERECDDPAGLALFGVARDCAFLLEKQLEAWRRRSRGDALGAGFVRDDVL